MPKRNANVEDNDSKKFQKLSDREHILARPDMYCGSTSKVSKTIHVMNKKGEIEEKTVNIYIFVHHRITTTMNKGLMSGEMVLVSKPLIFSQRICQ